MGGPVKRGIIVAILVAVAAVVVAVVLVSGRNGPVESVDDLDQGDCVDAPGYLSGETETPSDLRRVDCDDDHDPEALVAFALTSTEAAGYRTAVPNEVCADRLDSSGTTAVTDMSLLLAGVVDEKTPRSGDTLACLAFKADGSQLEGRVGTR